MKILVTEGFLLGLAVGTTCLVSCGPIYAPYLMQNKRSLEKSILDVLEISLGRFVTYAIIGGLAGIVGAKLVLLHRPIFSAAAHICLSIFLIVSAFITMGVEKQCSFSKYANFIKRPLLLGIFTGINFCPSFLIALTKAISLAGASSGMLFFASFFVGTSVYLLPLSLFGVFGGKKVCRNIGRVAAVAVGSWYMGQALSIILHQIRN